MYCRLRAGSTGAAQFAGQLKRLQYPFAAGSRSCQWQSPEFITTNHRSLQGSVHKIQIFLYARSEARWHSGAHQQRGCLAYLVLLVYGVKVQYLIFRLTPRKLLQSKSNAYVRVWYMLVTGSIILRAPWIWDLDSINSQPRCITSRVPATAPALLHGLLLPQQRRHMEEVGTICLAPIVDLSLQVVTVA